MSSDYDLNLGDTTDESKQPSVIGKIVGVFYLIPRKARIVGSIILVAFLAITFLNAFKPEAKKRSIPETVVSVDVVTANPSNYPIVVNANGTVEAETRGDLVAQIRGEIVAVSDNFNTGGTFKKGDVLIQLDQRDYQAELSRTLANLSQSEANFQQEQATAKQAKLDWQRLGNTSPAPDLVLRKPQLTAAKAQYDSAKAAHQSAKLNLSRTSITAPYNGRIIERRAVLGQYVSIGSPIAEVFATEGVEVRLPISQEEFSQLGLDSFSSEQSGIDYSVTLTSNVGSQNYVWDATVTRTDSTFDINTRQIDIIAKVADPFGKISGQPALKIGQFITARIQGRTINDVFVIPNKSIREGTYVYTVRDGKLVKQSIDILWQDDQNAIIDGGIKDGELVVTTSLNSTLAGASAKLAKDPTTPVATTSTQQQSDMAGDGALIKESSTADQDVDNSNSGSAATDQTTANIDESTSISGQDEEPVASPSESEVVPTPIGLPTADAQALPASSD